MSGRSTLALAFFLPLALSAGFARPSSAQPHGEPGGEVRFVPNQLVVLLRHGGDAPAPEAVVEAQRQRRALPAELGFGNPEKVELAFIHRAQRSARETLAEEPDSPRARLERYLVLSYPEGAPLEAIQAALERNPAVELVERNSIFRLAVSPSDPLFDDNLTSPALHQWGSLTLNLPAAWDLTKGHAYVGLIDLGTDIDHPDLRAFDALGNYAGGNLRSHLSWDFMNPASCDPEEPNCVDEKEEGGIGCSTQEDPDGNCAGHGTHVSGIVAGTANNGQGVAGACWNCSVLMTRGVSTTQAGNGLLWHADHGAQAVSMSFGAPAACDPPTAGFSFFCTSLAIAEERDVVMTASPGNDKTDIELPASDERVMSIGGIEPNSAFWDRADEAQGCPCDWSSRPDWLVTICNDPSVPDTFECGSNYTATPGSAQQDLVAPAKEVLSTFYVGEVWNRSLGCWDDPNHAGTGYDVCTGTSMSSPYVAAVAGVVRSVNPLLSKADVRDALISNASRAGAWDPRLGYGVPDAAAAVETVLGRSAGTLLANRLTPLFQLFSSTAADYAYTTVPQMASGLTWAPEQYISPLNAPRTGGYGPYFPGGRTCVVGPCIYEPRASVYIFSTDKSPNGHPLVPLYRLSWDGAFGGNPDDRDHNYTTEAAGINVFADVGYRLDGVEGHIYQRCTPEPSCIPTGAVRLYRYYNAARDDWAVFPESQLASWQADGYSAQPGANPWIGYVYENVDTDGDWLINAFEALIGTNAADSDSDNDGASDGAELLNYPYGDPLLLPPQTIGEFGQVTNLQHLDQTVVLSRSYVNPVVITQPSSYNGGDPVIVRLTIVQPDRFTFRLAEPPNKDGWHTTETVSWIVLEAGTWELADGTELAVGKATTNSTVGINVAGSFHTVSFPKPFTSTPLALTQVQTNNDPSWVKTRQLLPGTTGFQVALEEEEASTTFHGVETIGWVAVTPAKGRWSSHRYQAGSTGNVVTDLFSVVGFSERFSSPPKLVAALASRNGPDGAALRYTSLSATAVAIKVEEDTTFDPEVGHTTETVHFIALEGSGTLKASVR